jgi:hypothetical protein
MGKKNKIKKKKKNKSDKINLRTAKINFKYRLSHCLAVNGAQFEHFV